MKLSFLLGTMILNRLDSMSWYADVLVDVSEQTKCSNDFLNIVWSHDFRTNQSGELRYHPPNYRSLTTGIFSGEIWASFAGCVSRCTDRFVRLRHAGQGHRTWVTWGHQPCHARWDQNLSSLRWPSPRALTISGWIKFIAPLFRGIPTGPEAFWGIPGVSELRFCAWTHLKKGYVLHSRARWGDCQIQNTNRRFFTCLTIKLSCIAYTTY